MMELPDLYFLGPKGTYSEVGAKKALLALNNEYILKPVSTISKVIELVEKDSMAVGVLPFENSIEGIVRQTIDNIYISDVKIQAEIDVKIEHCFISKAKDIKKIQNIISHPQALAQCQQYILNNFDEKINLIQSASTAQGANMLLDYDDSYGAIASEIIANDLKLNILDKNIGDIKENKTRFVLISKKDINLGKNTVTSVAFNTKNKPGALLAVLEILKKYNINLIYLESRPSKKVFGEYNFFADIDKGIEDITPALEEINKECNYYKFLGSYPVL